MLALLQLFQTLFSQVKAGQYAAAVVTLADILKAIAGPQPVQAGPDDAEHLAACVSCCEDCVDEMRSAPKGAGGMIAIAIIQLVLPIVLDWLKNRLHG